MDGLVDDGAVGCAGRLDWQVELIWICVSIHPRLRSLVVVLAVELSSWLRIRVVVVFVEYGRA